MARKKPMQYVPPEERPEFIAAVAALPADPAELERTAAGVRQLYHSAMLAGDVQALDDADVVYRACVIKLNGGTHFGSADIQGMLEAKFAAVAGQVPEWGQAGEFLLDVEGMRVVVKMCPNALSNHCGAELRAVDFDKPFISRTGYKNQYMRPANHLGRTVDQAVRAEVLELLAGEGGAESIDQKHGAAKNSKLYPWLADALLGVRPDGQLAMFGDAPKDLSAKVVLTNADRQRLFRQRQREQKAVEGIQSIRLTHTERCVLSLGLLAHEDLDHRRKDWATSSKPEFDALLKKLWPEGDNGRYLAEPQRSTRRPAGFLRDQLEQARIEIGRLKEVLNQNPASAPVPANAVRGEDFAALEVTELAQRVKRLEQEQALLEAERNKAFAAVQTLTERLRRAGLPTDYRPQAGE